MYVMYNVISIHGCCVYPSIQYPGMYYVLSMTINTLPHFRVREVQHPIFFIRFRHARYAALVYTGIGYTRRPKSLVRGMCYG